MTMQTNDKGHGLSSNMAAQLGLLTVAVVILLVIAWLYIW